MISIANTIKSALGKNAPCPHLDNSVCLFKISLMVKKRLRQALHKHKLIIITTMSVVERNHSCNVISAFIVV